MAIHYTFHGKFLNSVIIVRYTVNDLSKSQNNCTIYNFDAAYYNFKTLLIKLK